MREIIPEIEAIVNFYKPEVVEEIARETGFVQRESKLSGIEFLGIMTQGLYSQPDASLSHSHVKGHKPTVGDKSRRTSSADSRTGCAVSEVYVVKGTGVVSSQSDR